MVTLETESLLRKVADLQGQRNIWVCGAYSLQGIPLLENAASSGLSVAEQIGKYLWHISMDLSVLYLQYIYAYMNITSIGNGKSSSVLEPY